MTTDEPAKQTRIDSAENQAQYLVSGPSSVISKLRLLARNHNMITAVFDGLSMNTAVVEVLKDKGLVAMDYGPDEALNNKLLDAGRVLFKGDVDGVDVQFSASSITKAKYQGESVFAIPIPDSLLWVQRRQFFRVRIPLGMPATCEIQQEDGSYRSYKIFDICAGGLSLVDEYFDLTVEVGDILNNCKLELPEHGGGQVNLEVRSAFQINRSNKSAGRRVGCRFVNLGMSLEATLQRYIHALEVLRKRTDD